MKKLFASFLLFSIFNLFAGEMVAQTVKISAEIRPRFEYRHGYKTLFPDAANPASFVSQRTRLNGYFANPLFKAYVSLQDVRVWGDVAQLNTADVNGFSVHEAWGQVFFGKVFSIKLGRQEIVYDDHRIFGNVGWAQQARSHDAAILILQPAEKHTIDIGIAYNAMEESLYKIDYTNSSYKTFQLVHYHGNFGQSGISFLFLNNGMAYDAQPVDTILYNEKIAYSQTVGARYSLNAEKVKFNAAAYYQGGRNSSNNTLSAYYFAGDVEFHLLKGFSFGIGGEYLSGTPTKNQRVPGKKDKSFTPFYGTNHKFNGWMDYFYVGTHNSNAGLIDLNLPLKYHVKKVTFTLVPHYFLSAATVSAVINVPQEAGWTDYSNGLGTEIDFSVAYAVTKNVVIAGGYSHMFAAKTMQALKYPDNTQATYYKNTNNWGWIMVTFTPVFFSKK